MKMKLLTLNYQKNKIYKKNFFSTTIQNLTNTKNIFLITFITKKKKNKINIPSYKYIILKKKKNPIYQY